MSKFTTIALGLLGGIALMASSTSGQSTTSAESSTYTVDYLTPPDGSVLEVGGMDFLSDGRLVVSTRRGQVWIVDHPLAPSPADAQFTLFAEGLEEGLGLKVLPAAQVDGHGSGDALFVLQRGELSRLFDLDGDGRCDRIETVANSWGLSGYYHEFAFGLPVDDQGRFYITLNVSFGEPRWWVGASTVPYRGWCLRIDPLTGETTPVACGLRSPCGLGRTSDGRILLTDNQGDWVPSSPLYVLKEGAFYSHPASLRWTKDYEAAGALPSDSLPPNVQRTAPAIWIPYSWSRSTGNVVEDQTHGAFGPFDGQLFLAELTNGLVLRAQLEQVQGQWQGAVWKFRQHVGSLIRVLFAKDGTLFGGMTNRGWGGVPPADGICRIRATGKPPMEVHDVHLLQDGFALTFTQPVAADCALAPDNCKLVQYDYDWWWEYGSPERHTTRVPVGSVALSADRTSLTVHAPLQAAMMARLQLIGVRGADGSPLLHDEFAYAINQLPEGPPTDQMIAKVVAPPPPRELGQEGMLRLTFLDALGLWTSAGWSLVDADLDPHDPTKLLITKGDNSLVNVPNTIADAPRSGPPGAAPTDFTSKPLFGEGRYHVEYLLPQGGRTTVWIEGRYGIDLPDTKNAAEAAVGPAGTRHGAVLATSDMPERLPALSAYTDPGQWHELDVIFSAPRFDDAGRKTANARIERVLIDDVLLHEGVELDGPCVGAPLADKPEATTGPLVISGTRGACALRQLSVRPAQPADDAGWVPLFNGQDLGGWRVATQTAANPAPLPPGTEFTAADEDASAKSGWSVEGGVLVGRGAPGPLYSPRADFRDVELRASLRISEKGCAQLAVRAPFSSGWPDGYPAQVNSSGDDPQKTGSLYGFAPITTSLVGAGTWCDYRVRCVDEAGGTHVTIAVNGIVVTDVVDPQRRHPSGHIALQHDEGSVLELRRLEVREAR